MILSMKVKLAFPHKKKNLAVFGRYIMTNGNKLIQHVFAHLRHWQKFYSFITSHQIPWNPIKPPNFINDYNRFLAARAARPPCHETNAPGFWRWTICPPRPRQAAVRQMLVFYAVWKNPRGQKWPELKNPTWMQMKSHKWNFDHHFWFILFSSTKNWPIFCCKWGYCKHMLSLTERNGSESWSLRKPNGKGFLAVQNHNQWWRI